MTNPDKSITDKPQGEQDAPEDTPSELQVNLGYAEAGEADSLEEDNHNSQLEAIQTLSLDEMVIDDHLAQDHFTESATLAQPTSETIEAIVTLSEVVPEQTSTSIANQTPTQATIVADQPDSTKSMPFVTVTSEPVKSPESQREELRQEGQRQEPLRPSPFSPAFSKPLPEKSDNPFLPQHILDKLNQGRKDLADDIVQSSAALDVSTAILRTQARAERLNKPTLNNNPFSNRDRAAKEKQKLVDDLVDEYLPLVAAELRRRLHKLLDE